MDSGGLLEGRQGVLFLLEGGLRIPEGHLPFLEGFALLLEGPGERGNGCLLALELGLLALEFGFLLLECRRSTLQLSGLCLGFPSLLLCCGPLDVTLAGSPRQLLL